MKRRVCLCVALALAVPVLAYAQGPDLRHGTTLNVLAGGTFSSEVQQPVFGGAFGWELKPRFHIETTMKWFIPDNGAEGFSAIVTGQVPLTTLRRVVPYLSAGAGASRATFDLSSSEVPAFYRNRVEDVGSVESSHKTFVDPAIVFGGGVNFFPTRHLSLRPEVETMMVWDAGKTYFTTSVAVRLAYHFELHGVNANRRPR